MRSLALKSAQTAKKACEKENSLYASVRDGPYENETKTTIANFVEVVTQSTIRKLSQSFDAMVMQQGCRVEFDNIVTAHLRECLSRRPAGQFSDDERKKIGDQIFEELSKTARGRDKDVPLRQKIAQAIVKEYPQNSDMDVRFNNAIGSFEEIFVEKRHVKILWQHVFGDQRANEISYLKSVIESLLHKMLEERQAECYEDSMVAQLKEMLTESLKLSTKKLKLTPEQKLNIQVWTLQQFHKRMEDMQADWDKKNKASSILQQNKDRYLQIIKTRLDDGFTCAAEGQIIGQHLLEVTKQKAIEAENVENIRAIKGLMWTTNSEKVRLKYFKHLAKEVRNGKEDEAVAYFLNPTEKIEEWYKKTVDQYHSKSFGKAFAKIGRA